MSDHGSASSEPAGEHATAARAAASSDEGRLTVPEFRPLPRQHGIRVTDPVERVEFDVYTPTDVTPETLPPDRAPVEWCFPIDSAAAVSTARVTMPVRMNVTVREPDGSVVAATEGPRPLSVDEPGMYTVELENTPMKLYLACHGRLAVFSGQTKTEIVFRDTDRWFVGARSLHERPARTITTTTEPRDLMLAVSEFGAALKTTSAERSFPSLRGYPPLLERGDELDIPGGIQAPDSGVSLQVRPELSDVFTVAPLAYYLGASVEPTPDGTPRLATDEGFTYSLAESPSGGFEDTVASVFRHVFTLDCLTRTHGYYPVETAAYDRARECLPAIDGRSAPHDDGGVDFAWLYDQPLPTQLEAYLRLPFADVEPLQPAWRLHATVVPTADRIGTLPHLAADLATVTCRDEPTGTTGAVPSTGRRTTVSSDRPHGDDAGSETAASVSEFLRASRPGDSATGEDGHDAADALSAVETVQLPDRDAVTQTYIGEGLPVGGNKAIEAAFERKLAVHSSLPSHLSTTIVCNDPEMTGELEVSEFYTGRDTFEIDVDIHTETTRAELRDVLGSDTDFVHFVGHVTTEGLQCVDGHLDAADLADGDVSVPAFLLNGCQSYRQGKLLVERGAVAGIVTTADVLNRAATEIGHHFARLLNAGWPLDAAVEVIRERSLMGTQYLVVGDGTVELVSPKPGTPNIAYVSPLGDSDSDVIDDVGARHVIDDAAPSAGHDAGSLLSERTDDDVLSADRYSVQIHAYPTRRAHLGTLFMPYVGENDRRYLGSGHIDTFDVTREMLADFLGTEILPISMTPAPATDGQHVSLQWSDEIDLSD